jgi:rhamnosyltransferase subunit B
MSSTPDVTPEVPSPFVNASTSRRCLMVAMGSLGDLYPFIAVGQQLQQLGVSVAFCSFGEYQATLQALGFGFYPINTGALKVNDPAAVRYVVDPLRGGQRLMSEFVFPYLRENMADVMAAANAFVPQVILAGELAYSARLVSELTGIPWVSATLQPLAMHSQCDRSVLPGFPPIPAGLAFLQRWLVAMGCTQCNKWAQPFHHLRAELGLAPMVGDPIVANKFKGPGQPAAVLAMFDPAFAAAQPDWPTQTVQTAFPFYDHPDPTLSPVLAAFSAAGPAPVVVTLGSAAVLVADNFYEYAAQALNQLGCRGIFLLGNNPIPADVANGLASKQNGFASAQHLALPYAPHVQVFAGAAAIIHPGGMGTTAQALRAGVPSVVVPFSHDQPDNAHRLNKLGVSLTLGRRYVSADNIRKRLVTLSGINKLGMPFAEQARRLGTSIAIDGANQAANFLLKQFLVP